jgi:hypothetical protein
MTQVRVFSFLFAFLVVTQVIKAKDIFNEELVLKELNNDFVYSFFQFTTRWKVSSEDSRKLEAYLA